MHIRGQAVCAFHALSRYAHMGFVSAWPANPRRPPPSPYKLKQWRQHRRLTLEQVGEALGMTGQNYGKIERGGVELRELYVSQLAELFGIDAADLMREPSDDPQHPTSETVPVVGYVSAGAALALFDEGQGPFDYVAPPIDAKPTTVAARVEGTSLGPLFDQAIIFYDSVQNEVTPDLHGRLCVAGLDDGRVVVKQIMPGEAGRYHLLSNSSEPPIFNAVVKWAARVTDVRPR